jgi:hypothetical protein
MEAKKCSKCKLDFPNNDEFFYMIKSDAGLKTMARCRSCIKKINVENEDKINARAKARYQQQKALQVKDKAKEKKVKSDKEMKGIPQSVIDRYAKVNLSRVAELRENYSR